MSNNFYNHGSFPTTGSAATSASMRAELDSIAAGFDKMPVLTGNANKIVVVDATGTALTQIAILPVSSGGTNGTAAPTAGAVAYGTGTAYAFTAAGTSNQVLISNGGSAPSWSNLSSLGVTSFSAGTTGFTPSTGTTGAVTLAGTLATTNGGTGLTSFTANGVVYASSTSALTTGSALTFDGTTLGTTGALRVDGNTTLGDASTDTVRVNGYAGVGGVADNQIQLYVRGTGQAQTTAYGLRATQTVSVTSTSYFAISSINNTTEASTALTTFAGLHAGNMAALGAGATVANLYGVRVENLTQGTNNFGVWSGVSSASGKWNFYASGTADNYFAGNVQLATNLAFQGTGNRITGDFSNATIANRVAFQSSTTNGNTNISLIPNGTSTTTTLNLEGDSALTNGTLVQIINSGGTDARIVSGIRGTGTYMPMTFYTGGSERMRLDTNGNLGIGLASLTGRSLAIGKNITGTTTSYGVFNTGVVQSDVTTDAQYYNAVGQTAAAAFTLTNMRGYYYRQSTIGATSAVTNQYGFYVESDVIGATNNYGFYSNIASGTGRFNFYANGTADNYFAGNVGIGTSSPGYAVDVRRGAGVDSYMLLAGNNGGTTSGMLVGQDSAGLSRIFQFGANPLTFWTNSSERMRIDSSGNVGIGTTPNGTLNVKAQAGQGVPLRIEATDAGGNPQVLFSGSRTYQIGTGNASSGFAGQLFFYDGTAAATRMLIDSNGRVTVNNASNGALTSLTSSAASIAVNLNLANNFTHTTTENTTLANPTNMTAGQYGVIVITQGATPRTMAFGSYWKFAAGAVPSLTATASAVDVLAYYVESATRITARLIADVK